jgi:hypothetical protein
MAGSAVIISSELPHRASSVFLLESGPKSRPAEVRASVVAEKGGKPSGAKGRRKVAARRQPMTEDKPATVGRTGASTDFPKQAGDSQGQWDWVERSIWTERMLERLAQSQESTEPGSRGKGCSA